MTSSSIPLLFGTISTAASACLGAISVHLLVPVAPAAAVDPSITSAPGATGGSHLHAKTAIRTRRDPDGLFRIAARINGRPIRLVVDTGASVIVLSPADAQLAGVEVSGPVGVLSTVGGRAQMRWGDVHSIELGGRSLRGLRVAVTQDPGPSVLSADILSHMASFSITGDVLTVS